MAESNIGSVVNMIIEPKLIDKVWPMIWPLIKDIVVLETEKDVLDDVRSGARLLIIVGDGAGIIRSCGEFIEINYVGGKKVKEWWPQMSAIIDAVAKTMGAKKIVAFGRDAWKKIAPDYTPTLQRMYIKEVA